MEKTFSATGLVYGNLWGGGKGSYPSESFERFTSLKALMAKARKMLKSGALDSGMGFNGLQGAVLLVKEIQTIKQDGKLFCRSESTHHFIGKLSSKEKGFLLDNINMFLI